MREIKFRAYHTEKRDGQEFPRMLDWDELLNNDEEELACYFKNEFSNVSPLMQYTGLKDKNGREIYEGDIVRNHRDNSNELLEVLWQEEVAEHASDGIYGTKEVPGFRFKRIKRGLTTVFVAHVDLEVIGNIHQNPELLEASHASK
ncbi:YopX family protein [Bacillus sp. AG1]|uniref:YopX family protein n=1 Tax=Bacillus sp. AG1 TaxID=480127 RepID=UPI002AB40F58|nr:YopX family protein [Bacillus sp. AG1]MDY7906770.1 YopX family protein [Bacillus sp. AG1]